MGIYYHQRLTVNYVSCPPKITPKNEKVFKKLKFVVNAKQGVHIWIFKGAESKKWHLFCAKTTHSLCFGLFFIRGKRNTANSSGQNSRKYTPLYGMVCSMVLVLAYLNPKMLIKKH